MDEFNVLLRCLQKNEYKLVMVEGPRGVGKSTLINKILDCSDYSFYKTWGKDQKNVRADLIDCGLDLTQGTFFVLDFIRQVDLPISVIADRGFLTIMAYQHERYMHRKRLHRYYASLMKECRAAFIVLDSDEESIYERRCKRETDDEHLMYKLPKDHALSIIRYDKRLFSSACTKMTDAGLREILSVLLDGNISGYVYSFGEDVDVDTDDNCEEL